MNHSLPTLRDTLANAEASRRSERGVALLHKGAVNIYNFVPCPMKVRFKQTLLAYMDAYNARAEWPLYCPTILDGGHGHSHGSIEDVLRNAESADDLPEVIVTVPLNVVLSSPFREKYLPLYQGVNAEGAAERMAPDWRNAAETLGLGFVAFGGWCMVRDNSLAGDLPTPKSWADLGDPVYRGQLAMPGHDGNIGGTSLLFTLAERGGVDAVRALAGNVVQVRHFAQIVKGLDSSDPLARPFSVLPRAAAVQIPSTKNVSLVEFADGPALMPLAMLVRKDRLQEARGATDFFLGETFREEVLHKVGFLTPSEIDLGKPVFFPSWSYLARHDYQTLSDALLAEFKAHAPAFLNAA